MNQLITAMEHYRQIAGYQATIRSFRQNDGEVIRYHYQQPGHVRMEFERPLKGAILTYNPDTRRVHLWPLGTMLIPPVILNPDNPLIQSPTGQRVDHSDIGSLLANVLALQENGSTDVLGDAMLGDRHTVHLRVTGDGENTIGAVHRYDIWLDTEIGFPIKAISYDMHHNEIETVLLEDVEIDPDFPHRFFAP